MSKRRKNGKETDVATTLGFVAVLLIFVMLTGSVLTLFSPRGNTGSTVPGGTVTAPAPFGGRELLKLDFENIEYSNYDALLYKNNINSSLANAPHCRTSVENGAFKLDIDAVESNEYTDNVHFGFGIGTTQEECISVLNMDYLTIDMEYTLDNISNRFTIQPLTRASKSDYASLSHISVSPDVYSGQVNFYDTAGNYLKTITSNSFHLTYVIGINNEQIELSEAHVYINGDYLTSHAVFKEGYNEFCTIRTHFKNVLFTVPGSVTVDNVIFNAFGNGDGTYSGAIRELFEDSSMKLSECTDSIHYKR